EGVLAFRHAHRDSPFAASRFGRGTRDFARPNTHMHRYFGFFARSTFEFGVRVVGSRFGAFGDFDLRRFGVDFEAHRRFAFAFAVADAADLGRVGGERVFARRQGFVEGRV